MSQVTRPTTYLNWTSGPGANVVAPPAELRATGWQAGMPVQAAYFNWLSWLTDQWIQYLSEGINSTVLATSLDHSMRLIGGGTFAYSSSTNILSWSAPLIVSIPSIPDADNTIPAGQVTVPAGSLAYVSVNLPFTTSGDLNTGSRNVLNVAFEGTIAVGQTVTGTGIPANTTVTAISGSTLTLSAAATSTASQASLTFANTGALSVQVATSSSLVPNPQTTVIARSLGSAISVGVGSNEMWLRDQEQRSLVTAGYVKTVQAPAGVALAANQLVYMSYGMDDSRTAGSLYPVDAGATNGASRNAAIGFVHTATPSGTSCHVVQDGFLVGFSGLVQGKVYYADPSTPGALTATKPTANNQYIVPVGVAVSSTMLLIAISQSVPVTNVFPGIIVNGPSQLNGDVTTTGNLSVAGTSTLTGATSAGALLSANAGLSVKGNATFANAVTATGVTSLNGSTNLGSTLYVGGIATFNDTVRGVSGPAGTDGTQNWVIGQAGTATFTSLTVRAGIKSSIRMGTYWGTSVNSYVGLSDPIVNLTVNPNVTGLMPRKWIATHAGTFVRGGFTFFAATAGFFTVRILKNGNFLVQAQSVQIPAANYYTTTLDFGSQSFAINDTLEFQVIFQFTNTNIQVAGDLTITYPAI